MYYPDTQRFSPVRSLSWRWERATDLLDNGRYWSRCRDDDWTLRAMAYIRTMRRVPPGRPENLARVDPEVYAAHQLYDQRGPRRLEIEARLLAGQTVPEVAARVALPEPTVAAFEALFFHVRDRLEAADWITVHALGRGNRDSIAAIVLRSCAYYGGLVLLDAVLPYLIGTATPLRAPQTWKPRRAESSRACGLYFSPRPCPKALKISVRCQESAS